MHCLVTHDDAEGLMFLKVGLHLHPLSVMIDDKFNMS